MFSNKEFNFSKASLEWYIFDMSTISRLVIFLFLLLFFEGEGGGRGVCCIIKNRLCVTSSWTEYYIVCEIIKQFILY